MSPAQCRVHQLPEWEDAGLSPSYEYLLPTTAMLDDHRAVLDPWVQQFQSLDPSRVEQALRDRWDSVRPGPLRDLLEYFGQYRPVSIVVREEKSWLRCTLPETATRNFTWFLLPAPDDVEPVSMRLSERDFADPREITTFLGALSGWREDWEPSGGAFLHARYECRFLDEDWMREAVREFHEWKGALFLYGARNGDTIVVHPSGHVGWWRPEEETILPLAENVRGLCHKLLFHYRHNWRTIRGSDKQVLWPLDSFVEFNSCE